MGKKKMNYEAARRIQSHVDKTGKNQDFKKTKKRFKSGPPQECSVILNKINKAVETESFDPASTNWEITTQNLKIF